jgi:hypothetical protein
MSLNQTSPLQGANVGFGGQAAGQYEPLSVAVTSKTSARAVVGVISRGDVITVEQGGANAGKIRIATSGDVGPFGMCYKDKASSDPRIEFISLQVGFIGYLVADGAIKPGEGVIPSTGTDGQVIAEIASGTVVGASDELVGTFISKANEVSRSGSGVYVPSDAADGDIIRVAFAGTRGEIF